MRKPPPPTQPAPSALHTIGRYEVERVLGRGAMGSVYLALDPLIQRRVALKTIRADLLDGEPNPDDEASDVEWSVRFINEARAAGRLTHPHIVSVFDFGHADGNAYIALEYVDGGNLAERLAIHAAQRTTMPLLEVLVWFAQLLDALAYAHDLGVVHRDIKPANLLIGSRGECKIADFGIAQLDTSRLTAVGMMIGTPNYMSPEQYTGHGVDARSDLFSAGVVLYELVTGRCPFSGHAAAVMHQVLKTMPPTASTLVATLPAALDAMLLKALAKRPEDRYVSALAWRTEVLELIARLPAHPDSRDAVSMTLTERERAGSVAEAAPYARRALSQTQGLTVPGAASKAVHTQGVFSATMLADLERRLASHVGPVASLLVQRAIAKATDVRGLAEHLSAHAPSDAARRGIDAALTQYTAAPSASSFTPDARTASKHTDVRPGHLDMAGELDDALIKAATRLLATHIGPVASVITRRTTRGADAETFFKRLADAAPVSVDKTALLIDLRKLRH